MSPGVQEVVSVHVLGRRLVIDLRFEHAIGHSRGRPGVDHVFEPGHAGHSVVEAVTRGIRIGPHSTVIGEIQNVSVHVQGVDLFAASACIGGFPLQPQPEIARIHLHHVHHTGRAARGSRAARACVTRLAFASVVEVDGQPIVSGASSEGLRESFALLELLQDQNRRADRVGTLSSRICCERTRRRSSGRRRRIVVAAAEAVAEPLAGDSVPSVGTVEVFDPQPGTCAGSPCCDLSCQWPLRICRITQCTCT